MKDDPVTTIISAMEGITKVLWSAAALLAPWLVPLAPAIFLWWAVSQVAIETGIPETIAMTAGFVAALGLECVNIAAAHAAVQLSHHRKEHTWKFILAIGLVVFYVLVGVGSMTALGIAESVSILGVIILFLLAPVAITAQALTMDLVWTREDADREEEKEAKQQDRQAERDHELRMAQLEADTKIQQERVWANAEVRKERDKAKYTERPERSKTVSERSPEYDGRLAIIQEHTSDNPFSPADVQDWLGMSRTTTYEVLKYGQGRGVVQQVGHGQYQMNGKGNQ